MQIAVNRIAVEFRNGRRTEKFCSSDCILLRWRDRLAAGHCGHLHRDADVIVLANRTATSAPVSIPAACRRNAAGFAAVRRVDAACSSTARRIVLFATQGGPKHYQLDANCAYYFGRGRGRPSRLAEDRPRRRWNHVPTAASLPGQRQPRADRDDPRENPRRRRGAGPAGILGAPARRRIEAASAILEKHCRVRFHVAAVGTWNSDNAITDFFASLGEFEREVDPAPAQTRDRLHEPVADGPRPHPHGRHARAAALPHSRARRIAANQRAGTARVSRARVGPLPGRVAQPGAEQRDAAGARRPAGRQAGFHIQFDPVNTLVIAMVGEEMRRRECQAASATCQRDTRRRLQQIYIAAGRSLPDDPAGIHLRPTDGLGDDHAAGRAGQAGAASKSSARRSRTVHCRTRRPAWARTADAPRRRCAHRVLRSPGGPRGRWLAGRRRRPRVSPRRWASALDDSDMLATIPGAWRPVSRRRDRRTSARSGSPCLASRRCAGGATWRSIFSRPRYLAATIGGEASQRRRPRQGASRLATATSGFSFADLAADRAGIRFADGVMRQAVSAAPCRSGVLDGRRSCRRSKACRKASSATDLASQFGTDGRSAVSEASSTKSTSGFSRCRRIAIRRADFGRNE